MQVSERRACAAVGQHRSTQRKVPRGRDDEERLTADTIALARQYGRYGYKISPSSNSSRSRGWVSTPLEDKAGDIKSPLRRPMPGRNSQRCLAGERISRNAIQLVGCVGGLVVTIGGGGRPGKLVVIMVASDRPTRSVACAPRPPTAIRCLSFGRRRNEVVWWNRNHHSGVNYFCRGENTASRHKDFDPGGEAHANS